MASSAVNVVKSFVKSVNVYETAENVVRNANTDGKIRVNRNKVSVNAVNIEEKANKFLKNAEGFC